MRGWVGALIGVALLVIAVGVSTIVVISSSGDGTSVVDLEVGSCFDISPRDITDGNLGSVDLIRCADPHLAEVVVVGTLNPDDAPYPSDPDLFADVERACRDAGAVDSDAFGLLPIAPTRELWESFEGRFLCIAIPFGGDPVTGTSRRA